MSLAPSPLHVHYMRDDLAALLPAPDLLAVFGFGPDAPSSNDPRYLRVPLALWGAPALETWRAAAPVTCGREGAVQWSSDGAWLFGAIEVDEASAGGITAAARTAYAELTRFVRARGFPHLIRIWNYLDAITHGEGDGERYREFCVGRAQGLGPVDVATLPAATAIGRCDGTRVLQVYWLAAQVPGTPLENPRQVSAYRYPRQYGPQSPSFARAMLPPTADRTPLLLSGTAAVVGHASQHAESLSAQIDETLCNFDALLQAARARQPALPAALGAGTRLKAYVRDAADLPTVERMLRERLAGVPFIVLHAAVCRSELAVEIDGVHG
ncbi:MAG TPA: pteridine-dependent deoxygenase [Comamonadaceae bacterium]|uniref:chorismate transformation enzyme, FkbO/Hyg5 family n=1 Tax=Pulveribacter sp. TaxID=2678893 RepID=UPI000EEB4EF3|nr:hypothetical protein [Pulveribacter sp.]HCL86443.1 pteridine-dependent deoxygenase [Comamonadaceae bacterium]